MRSVQRGYLEHCADAAFTAVNRPDAAPAQPSETAPPAPTDSARGLTDAAANQRSRCDRCFAGTWKRW